MPSHSNNRDRFNFARAMGVLDDDECLHVAAIAANDSRHKTAISQLGHSPLSRPTKHDYSYCELN